MVDKEQIKAVLEAVTKEGGVRVDEMKSGTLKKGETPEDATRGRKNDDECCCADVVVYVVFTRCLTVNNCAQADWKFCKVCDD